jgi:hypothetical protein
MCAFIVSEEVDTNGIYCIPHQEFHAKIPLLKVNFHLDRIIVTKRAKERFELLDTIHFIMYW